MTEYKVLKNFKGSPDGATVVCYSKGEIVPIPDDLARAVIDEGYIEAVKKTEKPKAAK